jgi:hypothetical protein
MEIGENTGAEDLVSAQRSAAPATTQTQTQTQTQLPASLSLSLYHTSHHSQSATDHTTVTQTCTGVQPPRVKRKKKWKEGDET